MTTEELIEQLELLYKKLNTATDFYYNNLWECSLIHTVIE